MSIDATEAERLNVLENLAILDTLPEREFDALAKVAKRMFGRRSRVFR
jgi:hypothetical protein